jgi:chemotaxis methyl-accepting protein methylase
LHGIDLLRFDEDFLRKSFRKRLDFHGLANEQDYCALIRSDEQEALRLVESFQVNYSEFFRNPLTFSVLEHIILPGILYQAREKKKKGIRIWSAACAEGQEIYSLAILMKELMATSGSNPAYILFATDNSERNLAKAASGTYTAEEIGNVSLKRINRWFHAKGKQFTAKSEIRENLNFSAFDLSDERWSSPPAAIFGDFNLVFCANILFYYNEQNRKIILDKLSRSLAKNAYLITGEAERDILFNHNFIEIYPHSAIFQKRQNHEN